MSGRGQAVEVGARYFAGALSLVFHPCNPFVPTFRSDIRYFKVPFLHGLFLLLDNSASTLFSSLFLSLILCCHKLRSELGVLWKRIWPLLDGLAAKIIMSILNS